MEATFSCSIHTITYTHYLMYEMASNIEQLPPQKPDMLPTNKLVTIDNTQDAALLTIQQQVYPAKLPFRVDHVCTLQSTYRQQIHIRVYINNMDQLTLNSSNSSSFLAIISLSASLSGTSCSSSSSAASSSKMASRNAQRSLLVDF